MKVQRNEWDSIDPIPLTSFIFIEFLKKSFYCIYFIFISFFYDCQDCSIKNFKSLFNAGIVLAVGVSNLYISSNEND